MAQYEKDWVDEMEWKRRAREEKKRAERNLREAAKAEAYRDSQEYKDNEKRKAVSKFSSTHAICAQRFELPKMHVHSSSAVTSEAEEWWNSTLNKHKDTSLTLWTPRQGDAPEELREIVDKYGGKSVRRGYRGYYDEKPGEATDKEYDEVMAEYNEHERLARGRTHTIVGTQRARPNGQTDPMAAARWLDVLRGLPLQLEHALAAERVSAASRLADMSEETRDSEAAELVELGIIGPLLALVNEAEDEHRERGVHQFLQGTKQGSDEDQLRYVYSVHCCAARALRNLLCVLSSNFSLQPRAGCGKQGTISYDWLKGKSASFVDIVVTQPGIFELLFRLLVHPSVETQEHVTFCLLHIGYYSDSNKGLMLETKGLLDVIMERACSDTPPLQEATLELLMALMHNNAARLLVLEYEGAQEPVVGERIIHALTIAMGKGTDRARGFAARAVWELCARDSTQRKPNTALRAHRSPAKGAKKGGGGGGVGGAPTTTNEEAQALLGEGVEHDFVKQDVCREHGLLGALTSLIRETQGTTQEVACGAMWCLSLERANKRRIGLFQGVVEGLSEVIKSTSSTDKAKKYAANGLRNLATDTKTVDHMSVLDKGMVSQLVDECEISKWQLAIVADI